MICFRRFSSAKKYDSPAASESAVRRLVKSGAGDTVSCSAQTGSPIHAKRKFTPTVRRYVLLPAMFAPVMTTKCGGRAMCKSLRTQRSRRING